MEEPSVRSRRSCTCGADTPFDFAQGRLCPLLLTLILFFDLDFGFDGGDASTPEAGLVLDAEGNLYGTSAAGGQYNYGTVFELTLQSNGNSSEKIPHDFGGPGDDGITPIAGVTLDRLGNLYGATIYGGEYGDGAVFEITP